ncbi:MAG: YhbY family RNA-binding protein [Clostridia bacterium]|jgi:RNA-binding protein|nr:YhbY family RNA-binding protein [Clostridia bacterium]
MLTSKQRAYLRSLANPLDTIQQIGKDGITEAVVQQVQEALTARELIKLKVLETSFMSAREASEALCEALEAEPVQCIGSKLVIYKANPKKADAIKLPKA